MSPVALLGLIQLSDIYLSVHTLLSFRRAISTLNRLCWISFIYITKKVLFFFSRIYSDEFCLYLRMCLRLEKTEILLCPKAFPRKISIKRQTNTWHLPAFKYILIRTLCRKLNKNKAKVWINFSGLYREKLCEKNYSF